VAGWHPLASLATICAVVCARLRLGLLRLAITIGLAGLAGGAVLAGCGPAGPEAKRPKNGKGDSPATKQKLQQARAAAKKGDDDRADKLYGEAFKDSKKFSILSEHVRFLIEVKRAARAVEIAKAYYDEATDDLKGSALYAEALVEAGQAKEALDVTDSLLELDGESARHRALHGRALLLYPDRRAEGIEELRRAREIDDKDPLVAIVLGEALYKAGNVDGAALAARDAVKLDPDSARAHILLGAAKRDQKEIDPAKEALRRAMELDPGNGRPYFEMGILHNQLQEQADAEQALAKAVDLDPEDTTYWYAYGQILQLRATQDPKAIDQGKLDLAINAYKRSLSIKPPYPKAAGKLAQSLVQADRHDEAEVLLTSLVREEPDNATNYYHLAGVYAEAKKYKLAIDTYERFLELAEKTDPAREDAKKEILQIKRRL
jgi:tetratricopeptide (TPR) repeat protein